jgi:hypothetical protein
MTFTDRILRISLVLALCAVAAALILPRTAHAATTVIQPELTSLVFQAPFTDRLEVVPGKNVRFRIDLAVRDLTTAGDEALNSNDVDGARLYALLYDGDDYLTFVKSADGADLGHGSPGELRGTAVNDGAIRDQVVTLPPRGGYDGVAFVWLLEGLETGDDGDADDTLELGSPTDTTDNAGTGEFGFVVTPFKSEEVDFGKIPVGAGDPPSATNVFPHDDAVVTNIIPPVTMGLSAVRFHTPPTTGSSTSALPYRTFLDIDNFGPGGNSGATEAQVREIAANSEVRAARMPLSTSGYEGPLLESAATNGETHEHIKLTFNAGLGGISTVGTDIPTTELEVFEAPTPQTDWTIVTHAAVEDRDRVVRINNNGTAFPTTADLLRVEISRVGQFGGICTIRDSARNCAVGATADITNFQPPMFAGRTADVIATGGTCVDTPVEVDEFHKETGQSCAGGTLVLTATLSETLGAAGLDGIDHIGDIDLSPAGLEGLLNVGPFDPTPDAPANGDEIGAGVFLDGAATAAAVRCSDANECAFTIAFADDSNAALRVNEDGHVEVKLGDGDFQPIKFALDINDNRTGAAAPATSEGLRLESATTPAENVFTSLHRDLEFVTSDQAGGSPDGKVDGVNIKVRHAIADELGDNHGVTIVDADEPATEIAATPEITDAEGGIVRVTADDQADVEAIALNDGSDLATDRTWKTDPPIPYNIRIADSTLVYAAIYNAETGEPAMIPDQADNAEIEDGAAPIIEEVGFRNNLSPGGAGQLVVTASENLENLGSGDLSIAGFRIGQNAANAIEIDFLNLGTDSENAGISGGEGRTFNIGPIGKMPGDDDLLFLNAKAHPTGILGPEGLDLVGPSAGVLIGDAGAISDDPEILRAFAQLSEDGKYDSVMVVVDSPVEKLEGGAGSWTATIGKTPVTFQEAGIEVTGNMVKLAFPEPLSPSVGLVGSMIAFASVEDEDGVPVSSLRRVIPNDSSDQVPAYLIDGSKEIEGMGGSAGLFAQGISGTLAGANLGGAVIRAAVVMEAEVPSAGPNSVCTVRRADGHHTAHLRFGNNGSVLKAIRAGQRTVDLSLEVDTSNGVVLSLMDANSSSSGVPVRLDIRTGSISAISGMGVRVSNCRLDLARSLIPASDPSMIILPSDAGADGSVEFDMVVGVDESLVQSGSGTGNANVSGCVFMTAERWEFQEDGDLVGHTVTPFTSCDPAAGNYVAFSPPVVTGVEPELISVDVDLGDISTFEIDSDGEWQLASMVGADRVDTSTRDDLSVRDLFVCSNGEGSPVSIVSEPETNLDELFSLSSNDIRSFVEVSGTAVFNTLKNSDVGENFAFAFRQEDGGQVGTCSYITRDGADGVFDLGEGWTLARVGSDCGDEVEGIIAFDANGKARVAVDNVDAALAAAGANDGGMVAFIYSSEGKDDFDSCSLSL